MVFYFLPMLFFGLATLLPELFFSLAMLFPLLFRVEMMSGPVMIPAAPVIPIPGVTIVPDLLVGMPANYRRQGGVADGYPGPVEMGRRIPDITLEQEIGVGREVEVIRDPHCGIESQLGGFYEEGRLLDDHRRGVNRRRRGGDINRLRDWNCDLGAVADVYSHIEVDIGGVGKGSSQASRQRHAKQGSFHAEFPPLINLKIAFEPQRSQMIAIPCVTLRSPR
jgi:hypothetical protein